MLSTVPKTRMAIIRFLMGFAVSEMSDRRSNDPNRSVDDGELPISPVLHVWGLYFGFL